MKHPFCLVIRGKLLRDAKAHKPCAAPRRRLAVAAHRPGAMEDKEAPSAYEVAFRLPASLFAVPFVIRAHRAQLRRAENGTGMVASAPRVDMGPGPPATACRKCRTATSHDELPRALLHCVKRCSVLVRRRMLSLHSIYTKSGSKRCAHAETCPALTQVVSQKKVNAVLPIARQRFQRLSRAREVRNREEAANVRTFFELRFAENCAVRARRAFLPGLDC